MRKPQSPNFLLTEDHKKQIRTMLLGPWKKEWLNEKGQALNEDKQIADRMGIPFLVVARETSRIMEEIRARVIEENPVPPRV